MANWAIWILFILRVKHKGNDNKAEGDIMTRRNFELKYFIKINTCLKNKHVLAEQTEYVVIQSKGA